MADRERLLRIVRLLLTVALIAATFTYIGIALQRHWSTLAQHEWHVRPGLLALSFGLASTWFLLRARVWQLVLRLFGARLPYGRAFRIWALSELGRYVPGKVVYVLGRSYLASRAGVRAAVGFASMAMELAFVLLAASVFFVLPVCTNPALRARYGPVAAILILGVAVAAHPRVLVGLLNAALRRMGKETVDVGVSYASMLRLLVWCLVTWAGMGLAFFVFAASFWPVGWEQAPAAVGAYALAWSLGLVAVVSPGGLGIREAILVALLGSVVSPGGAAVIAVASRVWITLAELLCAAAAALMGRQRGGRAPSEA
jgi:uncharacterized membrane protein YbhN (UPF0104 family)